MNGGLLGNESVGLVTHKCLHLLRFDLTLFCPKQRYENDERINKGMNDLVEQSRRFLNEQPDEQEYELLNEFISLRTGAIAVGLGKVKQYANKTDQEVRNLKSYANKLSATKDQENANKQLADALEKIGNLFYLQRKMGMYIALTSAATGVGIDKSAKILKRMEKQRR